MRRNVEVSDETWRRVRVAAVSSGQTVAEVVEQTLRAGLAPVTVPKAPNILPPESPIRASSHPAAAVPGFSPAPKPSQQKKVSS